MKDLRAAGRGRGFTLVELLVVVAVMTILMGLLVAGAARFRIGAMRAASKAMCDAIVVALDVYNNEYRAYPTLNPDDLGDLSASGAFHSQFWKGSTNWWTPEGVNAGVVYQMLVPENKGPYLDASSSKIPLLLPKDSAKQPVEMTINNILIRLASDKFENPLNIVWTGNATFVLTGKVVWGYIEYDGSQYTLTARNETVTFTPADRSAGSVRLEYNGLRVWSSGQDGIVHTSDDVEAAIAGR